MPTYVGYWPLCRDVHKGHYVQFPVMYSLRGRRLSSPWIRGREGVFNFT